jgi:hypothetical protein
MSQGFEVMMNKYNACGEDNDSIVGGLLAYWRKLVEDFWTREEVSYWGKLVKDFWAREEVSLKLLIVK